MLTDKQKHAIVATILIGFASAIAIALGGDPEPADGCQPCDCTGAVVALPGDVTALAADASAVTAAAQ